MQFQNRTGDAFGREFIWNSSLIPKGKIAEWHSLYSRKQTKVIGTVSCRASGKPVGIGGSERSWADTKKVKSKTRNSMSSGRAEKQTLIYGMAHLQEARMMRSGDAVSQWTEDDINCDLGLNEFGAEVPVAKSNLKRFNNFVEDWEEVQIHTNTTAAQYRLDIKYRGINFYDDSEEVNFTFAIDEVLYKKCSSRQAELSLFPFRIFTMI